MPDRVWSFEQIVITFESLKDVVDGKEGDFERYGLITKTKKYCATISLWAVMKNNYNFIKIELLYKNYNVLFKYFCF